MVASALLLVGALGIVPVEGPVAVKNRSADITITPAGEPGEPLVIEGRVLSREGKPISEADVYVYQTDARGYYSAGGRDERNPRIKGWLRTDQQGRYQVRTIKPGPYPGSGPPAHVHYEVSATPGQVERFELVFEGDSRLTPAIRSDAAARRFYTICTPHQEPRGTLRCRDANLYLK